MTKLHITYNTDDMFYAIEQVLKDKRISILSKVSSSCGLKHVDIEVSVSTFAKYLLDNTYDEHECVLLIFEIY